MNLGVILLLAVSLAMDATAASVAAGMRLRSVSTRQAGKIGLFFGGFQALMPLAGYALGRGVCGAVAALDHWLVLILLGGIGIKMILDAGRERPEQEAQSFNDTWPLMLMALATSIDALAVGVSLALMKVDILFSALIIGMVTATLCVLGVAMGERLGQKFERRAAIAGGVVLILIGIKVVVEHMGGFGT